MVQLSDKTRKDHVLPDGKWEFDQHVTDVFGDMLERSIPQYQVMRNAVADVASVFVKPSTNIVDVGCSRGDAMKELIDRFGAHNRFVGLEISDPMLEYSRARFKGLIECSVVDIRKHDLRNGVDIPNSSVILSVLTIQFTPMEYRQKIINSIFLSLNKGGAFILVEKVLGSSYDIDFMMVNHYYDMKRKNGYSDEEIARKRMALEGVLVPMTAEGNEKFMRDAGFSSIDCFWRWMNFAAWIAIK